MKNISRTPYIYKVTNLETGQYYIGSQCSGKTVGVNYFTSSHNKEFKEDFKAHKEEKYKIERIKEFEDPDECVRAENYVIRNYMLKKDGLCLNRAYCCSNKKVFSTVGTHPKAWNKGIPRSEETRKRISEACKGIPRSEETRKRMSEARKGTHLSEETRKKLSKTLQGRTGWNKGIPCSEDHKKKISETMQGRPSLKKRKISIEGVVFESLTEASKYYNVGVSTISCWIENKKHNAFYIEKCPKI